MSVLRTGLLRTSCNFKWIANYTKPHFLVPYRPAAGHYHHSSNLHRYFTNRYHKKVCPSCMRPNILPALACSYCLQQLTDAHICSIGRDSLRDLVLTRHINHDQSNELQSKVAFLERKTSDAISYSLEDLLRGLPQPLATEGHGVGRSRWCVELFRSFHFVVATYPFPASMVHLVAIPKASMYDIRQLRRSHLPLLKSMNDKLGTLTNLMINLAVSTSRKHTASPPQSGTVKNACKASVTCNQTGNALEEKATDPASIRGTREQIRQLVAFGFNYPSEYGQLCLHAVVPPIDNFGIFDPPYFYPINKVLRDLEQHGSAQLFPPSAILSVEGNATLKAVRERDFVARRLLRIA